MHNKNNKINFFTTISLLFLPLLFISDGISKYFMVQGMDFYRLSLFIRMLFEVIIIVYILLHIKKYSLKILVGLLFLFISFLLGQMGIDNLNNLNENFISFNKYIYLFLVYLFFLHILKLKEQQFNRIYKLLEVLFLLNIIAVFSGLIFDLNFFESFYNMNYRFGYNGIYLAGNESSFVLICMIAYLYFKAFYENGSKIFLSIVVLSTLLSGMKAVYIFLILLILFHLFNKVKIWTLFFMMLILSFTSNYVFEYLSSNEFQHLISFFINTLEEKGWWYMILSGRNMILETESALVMNQWGIINYLFGGRDVTQYIMEMDLFDLLLFFGILGGTTYLYLFYQVFIQKIGKHAFFRFFIFSILLLSFFGGHFLTSPTTAVYFVLVILYFKNYRMKQHAKNTINK